MGTARAVPTSSGVRDRLPGWRVGSRWAVQDRAVLAAKCAVAAVAAWSLAQALTTSTAPYYAPMTAFLVIHPTVATSLQDGVRYLAAAMLGVGVALAVATAVGADLAGIAVAVGVAVLVGGLPWLGSERATVPFWALFVLVVGGGDPFGYVSARLPEAAIGVVVGFVVNLVLLPPVRLRPADQQLRRLRQDLADVLQAMATDLREHWPPDQPGWDISVVQVLTADARAAVRQAGDSLRWNLRGHRWREYGRSQQDVADRLEGVALAARTLSTLLLDASRQEEAGVQLSDEVRPLLAQHLTVTACALRGRPDGDGHRRSSLRADIVALHHEDPTAWLAEGAVVVQTEGLRREVAGLPLEEEPVRRRRPGR